MRPDELWGKLFQAHPWHGIPAYLSEEEVNAFIEIVPSDAVKYELDKSSGHLKIDRPQRFSNFCPTLYGFIAQTYCAEKVAARATQKTKLDLLEGDGDPLDICVLSEKAFSHGNFLLAARPIGGFRMIDRNQADDKILAVLKDDITYGHFRDVAEVPRPLIDRLKHYFLTYKRQPDMGQAQVSIAQIYHSDEAREVIRLSMEDYRTKFGAPETRLAELKAWLKAD